jgi:glycosyltransferase 2 family protein
MISSYFSKISLKLVIKILIAIMAILFLLNSGSLDFYSILIAFKHLDLFVPALVCLLFGIVLSGIRWWVLLGATNNIITIRTALSIQFMGSFFSSWLPGAAGGDAVKGVLLYKLLDSGRSSAIVSIAVDRLFAVFGLVTIAVFSSIYLGQSMPLNNTVQFYLGFLYYGVVGIALLIIIFIAILWVIFKFSLQSYLPSKGCNYLSSIFKIMQCYKNAWVRLILCAVISMIASGIVVIGIIFISLMFDFAPSPAITAIAGVMGNVSSVIPVSPGGLGVGEAVFSKISSDLSHSIEPFATIYFTFRIGMLISNIPGMVVTILYSNTKHRTLNRF